MNDGKRQRSLSRAIKLSCHNLRILRFVTRLAVIYCWRRPQQLQWLSRFLLLIFRRIPFGESIKSHPDIDCHTLTETIDPDLQVPMVTQQRPPPQMRRVNNTLLGEIERSLEDSRKRSGLLDIFCNHIDLDGALPIGPRLRDLKTGIFATRKYHRR